MTITTIDQLVNALANDASRLVIDKASIANQTANTLCSLWRATGIPAQGAIPGTTPAIPTKATLGAVDFTNQTAPRTSYFAWAAIASSLAAGGVEVHDRVAHMGGLVLNVITSQVITGLDLQTLGLGADRRGAADYSDVQWYLETYTDGGATASNATVNVTYDDASTGNLNVIAVGGTLRASRMLPLTPFIPSAQQGRKIKGINSVILSASTGTAGNFGFTCTRQRTGKAILATTVPITFTWQDGLPEIPNDACTMFVIATNTTSSGTLRGQGKIAHG